MEENTSIRLDETQYPADYPIPFDLFVSKKYKRVGSKGFLRFTDPAGNLVYKVKKSSNKSAADDPHRIKLLLDSSANTLFSICRLSKGSWRGFRGIVEEQNLIFVVNKTIDEYKRTEFKILLSVEHNDDSKTELRMIGSPFKRSCTIYKDNSIVAETSLMYKLGMGKAFVPRSRFRVTIFPGSVDPSLVASLIVVYFDGRKLWI
ncbi:protein lurp-one-related 7 [Phtheirospermum japonicum]|uniref:Protein lurp-one-related 7 n=1 Tax=Phtheirospermum japonicum TaxID=374723 RepID=A0A830B7A8_9LAMI|nr:protein lurp-one-related 7 [Phtheirospermum japonicum]